MSRSGIIAVALFWVGFVALGAAVWFFPGLVLLVGVATLIFFVSRLIYWMSK